MSGAKIIEIKDSQGISDVVNLAKEIWPEYYIPIIGADQVNYMLQHFQSAAAIGAQINEGYRYFLIRNENGNVGYFSLFLFQKKGELFISKLYVKQSQRGQGLGRQALEFIEALARSKGLGELTLMVNKNNFPARRFYEQAGFLNTAPIVKDIGGGFVMDDYLYSKKLFDLWARTVRSGKTKSNPLANDPTRISYLVILITTIILFLIIFFPKPHPITVALKDIDVSSPPYQSAVVYADPITKNFLGSNFVLTPVASYRVAGYLLHKYYYWPYRSWDRLSPFDLALVWGDLALPENLKYLSVKHTMDHHEFELKSGALFDKEFLNKHSSFNHIIPANTNILDAITCLKINQQVIVEGYLVNIVNLSVPGKQEWKTSQKRNDVGEGSCEIIYVTKITVNGKVYQ